MKLMWVCNMMPSAVCEAATGKEGSANWLDHALSDLREQGMSIRILCRGENQRGSLDDNCSFAAFRDREPYRYLPEVEAFFLEELKTYRPDVIHIWGTEYAHTLAMMNAAEKLGMEQRCVISIQGLCSVYARHYAEGIPVEVQRQYTLHDVLKRENILGQQRVFEKRGKLEVQALKKTRHVIGRTHWDLACAQMLAPQARYHFCNETLREPFYEGQWSYSGCQKHRIFASSCVYPVKGFHYLLEALAEVSKEYPDAVLAVPGKSFLKLDWKGILHEDNYHRYLKKLTEQYGLRSKIEFLGGLSPEGMKEQFLKANVFVLPSTIENSPNSLGEAMLLGTPCVAADVGGVTTMLESGKEGLVYQSTAPYMLASCMKQVFAMEDKAEAMGRAASEHARITHDPGKNLEDLLGIYREIEDSGK